MPIRILTGAGFSVFDLSIASGGVVVPDTVYEFGLPAPRKPRTTEAHFARLYGVDLVFQGDFVLTASGDLQRTRGLGAFKAAFARSLAMPKGDIFWRPDYGVGLVEFLNGPATSATVEEMKNRIRNTLSVDPAVEEITRNDVRVNRSPIGLIEVDVVVVVAGQPTSISLEIRREP